MLTLANVEVTYTGRAGKNYGLKNFEVFSPLNVRKRTQNCDPKVQELRTLHTPVLLSHRLYSRVKTTAYTLVSYEHNSR